MFREGPAYVIETIESLTAEDLALTLDSGQGWSLPMTRFIQFPGWHATVHAGQIDFLQTCWGDHEIYVG